MHSIFRRRLQATTVIFLILLTMIAGGISASSAHAEPANQNLLEELKTPVSIGDNVTIAFDGDKTFNISGKGKIGKHTFNCWWWCNKSETYYIKKLVPAVGDDIEQYTIKVNEDVQFPNDSSGLFYEVKTKIIIDPKIDTSNVVYMSALFHSTTQEAPDVSNWNTSNVESLRDMFKNTEKANPDVSHWNTSKVWDLGGTFNGAKAANPDVSNWDVSHVLVAQETFANTLKANPDVSNWKLNRVSSISSMFENAVSANPDVSNWELPNAEYGSAIFYGTRPDVLDVSNIDFSNMEGLLYEAANQRPPFAHLGNNLERFVFTAQNYRHYISSIEGYPGYGDIATNGTEDPEPENAWKPQPVYGYFSVVDPDKFIINKITDYKKYRKDPTTGIEKVGAFTGDRIPEKDYDIFVKGERYEIVRAAETALTAEQSTQTTTTPATTESSEPTTGTPTSEPSTITTTVTDTATTPVAANSGGNTSNGTSPAAQPAQPNKPENNRPTLASTGVGNALLLLTLALLFIAAGIFLMRRRSTQR